MTEAPARYVHVVSAFHVAFLLLYRDVLFRFNYMLYVWPKRMSINERSIVLLATFYATLTGISYLFAYPHCCQVHETVCLRSYR